MKQKGPEAVQESSDAEGRKVTSEESLILIRKARDGDREAWDLLLKRYYPSWLRRFHGKMGKRLRKMLDTADLVHSAFREVMRDMDALRDDAAFYSWVSVIINRKLGAAGRRNRPPEESLSEEQHSPEETEEDVEKRLADEEEYLKLLDAMIGLFPDYPDHMTMVYLRFFEKLKIREVVETTGRAERSVHRLIQTGLRLLRSKLPPDDESDSGSGLSPRPRLFPHSPASLGSSATPPESEG